MSTSGDIMSTLGDFMSISGDFMSTLGGYHDAGGEYHEYIGGCSVHWSFQYKLKAFVTLLPHMHHDIRWCTEHLPMYS